MTITITPDPYRLDDYEAWLRGGGHAAATIDKRLRMLRLVLGMWPDPAAVTTTDLASFLASEGFSQWTRLTYLNHLRAIFRWLLDEGVIVVDPTAKLRRPPTPRNRPRPLTPEEEVRALDAAGGDLRAWLVLGLRAGLRAHEVAKIHGSHVTESHLFVLGKGSKEAVLPVHPAVWELAVARPRAGYWFPGGRWERARQEYRPHVSSQWVTDAVTRHFRSLGIEGSFHRCRHTYGTNLVRAGANLRVVQELMRHSSLATTQAYLGVDEDEKQAAIRLLGAW